MILDSILNSNLAKLKNNPYPGRGIIIGKSQDDQSYIQVYFIMGRSENSRNRIFVREGNFVKNEPLAGKTLTNPSLTLYYSIKDLGNQHIVSNGEQTETIYEYLQKGDTFENALATWCFEPDPPHYTPRISGLISLENKDASYKLSILKSLDNDPQVCIRQYFNYSSFTRGIGHCIYTFMGDLDPLPSFQGEPLCMPLFNDINEVADFYWELLNQDNKISLLVKFIDDDTKTIYLKILNKHLGDRG